MCTFLNRLFAICLPLHFAVAWDRTIQLHVTCTGNQKYSIARWINPFGRGVGRWLTDITALVPLLASENGQCAFLLSGVMVNEVWMPKLNLVMVASDSHQRVAPFVGASLPQQPDETFHTELLFVGGQLNANYTASHPPVTFSVPVGTQRVEMYAIIDGRNER
jgi:hypothetical protein